MASPGLLQTILLDGAHVELAVKRLEYSVPVDEGKELLKEL